MEEFIRTETLIIELILVATLVAIVAGRIRLPYTVALVLVGLFISFQGPLDIEVTPIDDSTEPVIVEVEEPVPETEEGGPISFITLFPLFFIAVLIPPARRKLRK